MTHILPRPSGTHRADDAIAERDHRIDILAYDNEQLVCEFTRAVVRGCQDTIRIAGLEQQLAVAVAEVKRLQQRVIRDAADKARLRQAVIAARPRITVVQTDLVRPYAPVVVLPYISPLPVDVQHDYTADTVGTWPTYGAA